MKIILYYLDTL